MQKSFFYVLISTFLLVLGTYISGTILTPYARDMGATWFQTGILTGSMYIIRLFFGTPIGRLADKRGTLIVLRYSLFLYPFIAAAYYFAGNIAALIGARLLHGIASAMMLPMGMAYVGDTSPSGKEGKYMSIYNLSVILASGSGPIMSTMIADTYNYKVTFQVLFVLAILAYLVIQFSFWEQKKNGFLADVSKDKPDCKANGTGKQSEREKFSLIKSFKQSGGLWALGLANLSLAAVTSLVGFFFLPFLEVRGLSLRYTGVFIAVYYLVSGVVQLPLGKIIDKHNKYAAALISGFGTAFAVLLFPFTHSIAALTIVMILTALASASFLTTVSSLSIIIGRERGMGNTMGLLNSVNSGGMIFSCVLLGLLPGEGSYYNLFFYFTGIAIIVSTLLFAILWPANRRNTKVLNG